MKNDIGKDFAGREKRRLKPVQSECGGDECPPFVTA